MRDGDIAASLGSRCAALVVAFAALAFAPGVAAGEFEPEFRNLGLGVVAGELSNQGYEGFACGSNGGPPRAPLRGWADFARCPVDANGLHEVYVEFGSEIGRMAELFREQYGQELWIQRYGGTRIANFPVVLSLLFDKDGIARGFRAVTDSRAPTEDRGRSYLLRFRVMPIYGEDAWRCIDREPAPGETGVGNTYLNQLCTKTVDGKFVRVEAQFFRRPGQSQTDANGGFVPGQYQAMTRWEVFDAQVVRPD